MDQLFVLIYPLVTLISATAYMPQIVALLRATDAHDRISLSSWGLWIASSSISLGYGIFHLHDVLFCITMGLGVLQMSIVVALVLYNRHIRFAIAADTPAQG